MVAFSRRAPQSYSTDELSMDSDESVDSEDQDPTWTPSVNRKRALDDVRTTMQVVATKDAERCL